MEQKIKKIDLFNVDAPSFMMVMPTHSNSVENNRNNVWCDENINDEDCVINGEAAFGQWFDLYSFLANQGLVTIMPSPINKEGLADHVYAANSGIMIKDTYVVSNFTSEPRIPETAVIEQFMKTTGCKVVICPFKFEGEADMKSIGFIDGKETYIGGYGMRSTKEAYEWMEKEFDIRIIKVKVKDEKLYHLDCSIFPLTNYNEKNEGENKKANILCCTKVFSENDVEEIRKYCKIVDVPLKLAYYGATNCVRVGSYVLCGSDFYDLDPIEDAEFYFTERDKNQWLEDVLGEYGFEVIFFNLSEFAKAGACLSCNICHLNRYSYTIETV